MSERKVIAIDFDDVLIDFCPALMEFHNNIHNTSFVKNDILHFPLEKTWNCSIEEVIDEVTLFYKETKNVLPISGSLMGVRELAKEYDLVILTGRSDETRDYVEEWVDIHTPNIFKEIIFTNQFRGEKKMSKAEFCKARNAIALIDDFMDTAHDVSSVGIPVLLMDTPWNQGDIPNGVTRVKTWDDILNFFSEGK